jgi:hypothetical protein
MDFAKAPDRVELRWMNITPCSKVEWNPLPTVVLADQRLIGYADINIVATARSLAEQIVKECALAGVAACGLSSLLTSPASCLPVFSEAFSACATAKLDQIKLDDSHLSVESRCTW